ncbi:MFS transporter [Ornithinibacillus massiliensis]|uniref:MFS transporter n=1 Tax=Ornithinibacillus massiliensis TaxID=1944633 RepID=A0ABS5MGN6_9BACI|nr:MFS transporter [Ornithinibacillus massiliensis]MBS3681238.1 MFS transporter [Ornithinibacillus massiliensis]
MTSGVTQNKSLALYTLSISAFFASLSQNIYTPIIPLIRDSFNVSVSWVNFTVSSFIFIVAVIQILLGTVVDQQDKKRLLLISLILMGASAVICAYTNSFTLFILFRMVQAVGAGIIPLVAISMVAQLFEEEARGNAMGTYQILLTLAPAVAPVLGGFIGEYFDYEGIFYILFLIAIVLLLLVVYLPSEIVEKSVERQPKGFFQTYKAVLSHHVGACMMIVSFIVFFIYFAVLVYLPVMLQDYYHVSLQVVGLLYLPLSVSMILGSMLFKRLQKKISLHHLVVSILIIMPLEIILFGKFHTYSLMWLSIILFGYGIMVGFSAPLFSTIISKEYCENRGTALGVFNFVRYVGMALGGMSSALYRVMPSSVLFMLFGSCLFLISIVSFKVVRKAL